MLTTGLMYARRSSETRSTPIFVKTQPIQSGTLCPELTNDGEDPDLPEHLGTCTSPTTSGGVLKSSGCPNLIALEPQGRLYIRLF